LMSNSIGESISRLIEVAGSKVIRVSYGGDVGLHVAKCIYVVLKQKEKIPELKRLDGQTQLSFWAKSYVDGSTAYDGDLQAKAEIDNLNKIIFDKRDKEINELYIWGRQISIDHFQEIFKRLDTKFEHNFWESEVVPDALAAVAEGLEKKILEKSEGAVIFKGENYGLHTRVFVNSKGVPTYEAKELGLGVKKIELYDFDSSVIITGNEQNDYFKVLLAVMGLLRPAVKDKTVHIGHGMLRFSSGKMSSRKGNVITGVSLLAQVKDIILDKMKERDFSNKEREEIAEVVAVGAVKYSILKQATGSDIIFDFDKSLSFEGDSGPYLQYACVRAKSILEKAEKEGIRAEVDSSKYAVVGELSKLLIRFPEIVERAGREYSPHYLATYLTELASAFSAFYANEVVVDKDDVNSPYKVSLTQAFSVVMKNGLNLLGIKVPDRM
jgi:arginyl-tRNA synthetase